MSRAIASENLWRAQRDGVRASFIDEARSTSIPCAELLSSLVDMLAPDAAELGCASELSRTLEIVAGGSSADRQLAIVEQASGVDEGAEALKAVVDWIAATTSSSS